MGSLEDFWTKVNAYVQENPQPEKVGVTMFSNPTVSIEALVNNIIHMDELSDDELKSFVFSTFNILITRAFGSDDPTYLNAFNDIRFLNAFTEVAESKQFLNRDDTIRINMIIHEYLFNRGLIVLANNVLKDKFIRLATIIDQAWIHRLTISDGVSDDLAVELCVARFSSFDLQLCVRRVDYIVQMEPNLNSDTMIDIIKALYDPYNDMYRILPYFMLDTNPRHPKTSVEAKFEYAMMYVLEGLPTKTIVDTLRNYAEYIRMVNPNAPVRFSFRDAKLNDNLKRIKDIVKDMANQGIYVP